MARGGTQMPCNTHAAPLQAPSALRYRIGVDGGGTGTRARLTDADGALLGTGQAGPSGLGQGIEQAWLNIGQAIANAFGDAGLEPAPPGICALGLGLAGANVQERCQALLRAAPGYWHVALDTDGYASVLGAHAGRPGAVVAAGTGTVGEALKRNGERVMVGGWGFPIGDEGSGAWLGFQAMRLAERACDGRAPTGALAQAIWGRIGPQRQALLAWCETAGQFAYAQLAPLVFDTEAVDPQAADLLAGAVGALEGVAKALDPAGDLPLVVTGSIGRRLAARLAPALLARCVAPAGDATDGALRLLPPVFAEQRP